MQGSVRVARIMGVDIALHFSWFAVFALVTWSLSAVYFPSRHPFWAGETLWAAGLITSLLFFASVLAHELAHSLAARRLGIEVDSITLFFLGGMASISREADRARDEFAIAIVGPLSSLLLAVVFGAIWWLAHLVGRPAAVALDIASWLAIINLMLGIFNLIPGFPMDGGRVLRSLIWGITRNFLLATRIAATAGQVIAYLMILGGVYLAVTGSIVNAIWVIVVGWFLSSSAQTAYRQVAQRESLRGVTVDMAMTRDYRAVSPHVSLREAFEVHLRPHRLAAVPVVAEDARVLGLLTEAKLREVPRERWETTTVHEAMTSLAETDTVAPEDEVNTVLATYDGREFTERPVVDHGRLVGSLTQTGILTLIRRRQRRNTESPT